MKIVRLGKLPKPWAGRWKCPVCETVVELDGSEEPPPKYDSDYMREAEAIRMHCPVCGKRDGKWMWFLRLEA